jgi:5-methylcytosine-specific restriction protein B
LHEGEKPRFIVLDDKVLDRVFVMALSDVDFETCWSLKDESVREQLDEEFKLLLKLHEARKAIRKPCSYRKDGIGAHAIWSNPILVVTYSIGSKEAHGSVR